MSDFLRLVGAIAALIVGVVGFVNAPDFGDKTENPTPASTITPTTDDESSEKEEVSSAEVSDEEEVTPDEDEGEVPTEENIRDEVLKAVKEVHALLSSTLPGLQKSYSGLNDDLGVVKGDLGDVEKGMVRLSGEVAKLQGWQGTIESRQRTLEDRFSEVSEALADLNEKLNHALSMAHNPIPSSDDGEKEVVRKKLESLASTVDRLERQVSALAEANANSRPSSDDNRNPPPTPMIMYEVEDKGVDYWLRPPTPEDRRADLTLTHPKYKGQRVLYENVPVRELEPECFIFFVKDEWRTWLPPFGIHVKWK